LFKYKPASQPWTHDVTFKLWRQTSAAAEANQRTYRRRGPTFFELITSDLLHSAYSLQRRPYRKTRVSKTIRKPPLAEAQSALGKSKIAYVLWSANICDPPRLANSTSLARRPSMGREVSLSMDQLSETAYLLNRGHLISRWTFSKPDWIHFCLTADFAHLILLLRSTNVNNNNLFPLPKLWKTASPRKISLVTTVRVTLPTETSRIMCAKMPKSFLGPNSNANSLIYYKNVPRHFLYRPATFWSRSGSKIKDAKIPVVTSQRILQFTSSTDNNDPIPGADILAVPRTADFPV